MSTEFTNLEKAHFDLGAIGFSQAQETFEGVRQRLLASPIRQSYVAWLEAVQRVKSQRVSRILDYCAGLGVHTETLQQEFPAAEVIAIDISEKALDTGRQVVAQYAAGRPRPTFTPMDGHRLNFPDGHFDLVSEFGSFSSLDFDRALSEVWRVLRPGGTLIAVETYGHNPLANLKRKINVLRGTRTKWCSEHIFDSRALEKIRSRFDSVEVEYHIFFSLFLGLLPFKSARLSSILGRWDAFLLNRLKIARQYAFKVVVSARKAE